MSAPVSYLKTFAAVVLAVLGLAATFNFAVDPYAIEHPVRIEGVNQRKPAALTHLRLTQSVAVMKVRPSALILGSSRAHVGLDLHHVGWGYAPVHNLSLSGPSVYEIRRYLQHGMAAGEVRQVVLALDFAMFNVYRRNKPDFMEERLLVDASGNRTWPFRHERVATLFSIDTVGDGVRTLRSQGHANTNPRVLDADWQLVWKPSRPKSGWHGFFASVAREYATRNWRPLPEGAYAFADPKSGRDSLSEFREILDLAHANGVDLRMLISPSHAWLYESMAAAGLWDRFEEWKRALVRINVAAAGAAGAEPFALWDFSGYNAITVEPVPRRGDVTTQMRWYWDPSHYKREAGDLALDRVFGDRRTGVEIPASFGVRLTPANVEAVLGWIRTGHALYGRAYPDDAREIRGFVTR